MIHMREENDSLPSIWTSIADGELPTDCPANEIE
jgi:hypothetical protein